MTGREIERLAELIAEKLEARRELRRRESLVGVSEASEITGLSVRSLYNRKDEIGYVKRGRGLYFVVGNLEAYNERRKGN